MSRPALEEIRSLGNFAHNFRWNMKIVKIDWEQDMQNVRCVSSGIPKRTGTSTEIMVRGHKVKQPGVYNYEGTLTFTFVETVDRAVLTSIENWVEGCWETNTGVTLSNADVKSEVVLELLDNLDNVISTYALHGCFPESFDPIGGDLTDGSDAGLSKPTLTLSYDYYELT